MKLTGCSALITGASAGIGWEFARQLAPHAKTLVLVARRKERLEALQDELTKQHPNLGVRIRPTDLADEREIHALIAWIEAEHIAIDLLINNAGLGDVGPFANSEPERIREMILVNIAGLTLLTRRLLPGVISRKRGTILNVSSVAGFLPIAGSAVYAASKAYVTSFSEAIRAELRGSGVSVTALCPGPVRTEFQEVARRSSAPGVPRPPEFVQVPVEQVVRAALAGVKAGRAIVIPGLMMKLGMTLARLTPAPVLRFASRFSAKRI